MPEVNGEAGVWQIEQMRQEHEFGSGTSRGVAERVGVHRCTKACLTSDNWTSFVPVRFGV